MGHNALHVGIWRGCIELFKQVLVLYNLGKFHNHLGLDEQGETTESDKREDIATTWGQLDLHSKGVERKDHDVAIDDASFEGDKKTKNIGSSMANRGDWPN